MEDLEIKATNDKLIITFDRSSVDAKFLKSFLKKLKDHKPIAGKKHPDNRRVARARTPTGR